MALAHCHFALCIFQRRSAAAIRAFTERAGAWVGAEHENRLSRQTPWLQTGSFWRSDCTAACPSGGSSLTLSTSSRSMRCQLGIASSLQHHSESTHPTSDTSKALCSGPATSCHALTIFLLALSLSLEVQANAKQPDPHCLHAADSRGRLRLIPGKRQKNSIVILVVLFSK